MRVLYVIGVLGLVVSSVAQAAAPVVNTSFDLDHLQLSTSRADFWATEGAGRARQWDYRVALTYRYSETSLVYDQDGKKVLAVFGRHLLHLHGGVQLWRWIGIGADIPILLGEQGAAVPGGGAFGDIRLSPRVELLGGDRFGLAVLLGLRLPSGDTARFLGEGLPVFEPRIAAQYNVSIVRIGFNLGARFRAPRQYYDLPVGQEGFASLALAVQPKEYIDVSTELHADTALSGEFGKKRSSPVEWLLGVGGGWAGFRAGFAGGLGLVPGFGAPSYRLLAMLEYHRPPPPPLQKPVEVPPPPTGPPPPLPDLDEELLQPTGMDHERDVTVASGRIELGDPIFFETNLHRIRPKYFDELHQLARVLNSRPDLAVIWIEGHADWTGPPRWNARLSKARAQEVADVLVAHGVAAKRLKPVGFGEARPLEPTPQGVANERNRRVHFYTEEAPDAPLPSMLEAKPPGQNGNAGEAGETK